MEKAWWKALLTPCHLLKEAQDSYDHTRVLALQEEIKTLPWNEVWNEYCKKENCADESSWYEDVMKYEKEILAKRG